jgi:hypothetical protein
MTASLYKPCLRNLSTVVAHYDHAKERLHSQDLHDPLHTGIHTHKRSCDPLRISHFYAT